MGYNMLQYENITPSGRQQTQNVTCSMISFTCNMQNKQIHVDSRLVVVKGEGAGEEVGTDS